MSTTRFPVILPAILLSGLIIQPVSAEEKEEEIIVRAEYLAFDRLNSVKTPTPVIDVPQSLAIISAEEIEQQAFRSFGDIMRYTPGLSISQGEGHRDAIIIRGQQTTADFFIDGIRDDVQYYRPLYNVEQVEILRGANALLFGRGGGGGVINRVTKQAEPGEVFTRLSAGLDTFGAWSVSADSNLPMGPKGAVRLNAFYQELASHRNFVDGTSQAINPVVNLDLGPSTTGSVSYEYLSDDRVVDRGVPSVYVENGPNVPLEGFADTFFGSPEENLTTLEAHILRGRLEHVFSNSLKGNITLHRAAYDKAYQNLYASDRVILENGTITEVELDGYRDITTRENLIIQGNLVGEFATGGFAHTLLFGGEVGTQDTENARLDNVFAVNGDDQLVVPFTDPLTLPDFAFSSSVRDRTSDVRFASLYIQDQIDLGARFKLILGARYDEFDIDVLDLIEENDADATNGRFSRTDREVTPRLGAIYKPARNVSLYASYSETFLPRAGEQFLSLDLNTESTRPQFFENQEVGLKWDIRPNLGLTAAMFRLERESYTSVDPEDPAQTILIEGSDTDGFEIELNGQFTDRWSIIAGYAALDGRVNRADGTGNDGNRTRQTPENMLSLWNRYDVSERFSLGLGATWQDSFFVREDNSVEVPAFTRVDAAAWYTVSDTMRVQLNIENLLDETYFPDAHSNNNISTGKPLNARMTLSRNF